MPRRAQNLADSYVRFFARILIGLTTLTSVGFAAAKDEAAVRDVIRKYVEARDSMDARATEALFTSDADQLVSTGEWRRGRDAVVRGTMASSRSSEGKRSIAVETVRFLTPDVAIADGRYEISNKAGEVTRKMWTTLMLTRGARGWRIAAIRNMLPAPAMPAK